MQSDENWRWQWEKATLWGKRSISEGGVILLRTKEDLWAESPPDMMTWWFHVFEEGDHPQWTRLRGPGPAMWPMLGDLLWSEFTQFHKVISDLQLLQSLLSPPSKQMLSLLAPLTLHSGFPSIMFLLSSLFHSSCFCTLRLNCWLFWDLG